MGTMNDRHALQQVALLDTNTLHYVGLYLKYARERILFPFGEECAKAAAIENVNEFAEAELKRSLNRGLQVIDLLSTLDVRVEYSPVSELELVTGRTKGKAIMSLAKEGVPDRMWSRFPRETIIRDRIGLNDMAKIKEGINSLAILLAESGVAVKTHAREQTGDALELAKSINGLVYMEPLDSIIYASTLIARADYLFTSDKYLRKTVNLIGRGEGGRYEEINQRLKERVSQITLGTADEVELPSAHEVRADGKTRPPLPSTGS